ncbi:hypothetical protein JW766_03340 [Candidatus Dojkabacteria bacterium]|nr:hypothetical protein [Candidatus Dojkabacteria bacterium]
MIETEPIPLDRRLFTSFYRDGNLQLESTNPLGSDILPFFDPIIATWIDEATSSIDKPNQPDLHNESERVLGFLRNLPWEEVAERYWERHTDEYTSRLARLVEGVPGNFVTEKTKSIVVIAARNETDLERALQAVRDSYGDNFEEEVCILVYHNYTDEPSAEVWHALTKASQHFSNLHVINEQVPQFYNVGTAKKVAADLAMLVQRGQREVPLVLVDADISGLSPESIQQAINVLAETGMIDPKLQSDLYTPISHDRFHIAGSVAVSTAYDFDKEAKRKFPVLSLVWDLRRELFTAELANRNTQSMISKNPIGPFTVISLKVLCAIGGLMPIPFGDMALGRALDQLVLNYHTGLQSVYPLDIHGGVVYMNPDRQISSLIAGMPEAFHWSGTSRYLAVSGKQRFDWHEIDAI